MVDISRKWIPYPHGHNKLQCPGQKGVENKSTDSALKNGNLGTLVP